MKTLPYILTAILFVSTSFTTINQEETDGFSFKIESPRVNASQWSQSYRFDEKGLKTFTAKFVITRTGDEKTLNLNYISLLDETNKLRIRPTGVYYLRSNEKKKYLKSGATNKNYTIFEDYSTKGYTNFQVKTFKPNFLGMKKKNEISSVKQLKKIKVESTVTYFLEFPVKENFKQGEIYYKHTKVSGFENMN